MPPFVGHVAPLQSSEKMALSLVCMTDEQKTAAVNCRDVCVWKESLWLNYLQIATLVKNCTNGSILEEAFMENQIYFEWNFYRMITNSQV